MSSNDGTISGEFHPPGHPSVPVDEPVLRSLINRLPLVLFGTDRDLRFTDSLGGGLADLGLEPGQVVGMSAEEYLGTDDPAYPPLLAMQEAMRGNGTCYETRFKDRLYQVQVEPRRDATGEIVGVFGVAWDRTEDRTARGALEESEAQLRLLLQRLPAILYRTDADLRILFSSGAGIAEMGDLLDRHLGKTLFDVFETEDRDFPPIRAHLDALQGRSRNHEIHWEGRDIQVFVEPFQAAGDDRPGLLGLCFDMTSQREAEQRAQQQDSLMEAARTVIVTVDARDKITGWNRHAERLLGWTPDEVLGESAAARLIPEESMGAAARAVRDAKRTGLWHGELDCRHRDGKVLPVYVQMTRLGSESEGQGLVIVVRDFRRQRAAEEAMETVERRYRSIFENAVEGIVQFWPDGTIIDANPALARMFGFESPRAYMDAVADGSAEVHVDPEDRVRIQRLLEEQGQVSGFEFPARRRDGTPIWISQNVQAVRDADGVLSFYVGTVEDITERKRLEESLRQSRKMEAVGRLAGGVAHDFNNILTVIAGYCDLAAAQLSSPERLEASLEQIREASERAAGLTAQLLAFSRKQVLAPRVLRLGGAVLELEPMLRPLIGEHVDLEVAIEDEAVSTRVDPSQLSQVIINLAANARDAMPEGGRLVLAVRSLMLKEVRPGAPDPVPAGSWAVVAVSDDGRGLSQESLDHMFDPFFTTKKQGEGTGLGLATVYGVVRQSSGHIQVRSEPEAGTEFLMFLPQVEPEEPSEEATPRAGEVLRGGETVVVCEDES
ncbi:MAG: PAS domain S-box protein, partial [Planctomycetota bacterium]